MKKIALLIYVIIITASCKIFNSESDTELKRKDVKLKPGVFIPELPDKLSEGSGLMYYNDLFWSFNDSGGDNVIYAFNRKGQIQKEVEITNADNIDWEDIAQDDKYIYIGDFGNNSGTRKNLKIYKIIKNDLDTEKNPEVYGEVIKYVYQNQEKFNFRQNNNEFDCEALVENNQSLFIFTKNWIKQNTVIYEMPKNIGEYNLSPIDSFNTDGLVTGADISPDKTKLALIGYRDFKPVIRMFTKISNNNFFEGETIFIEMDSIIGAQTEGICFLGNDTLLISCERTREFNQQVFYVNLKELY